MLKKTLLLLFLLCLTSLSVHAQTDAAHPHLWITEADLPRLREWATDSNPIYRDGLMVFATQGVELMDAGIIPASDSGGESWEQYPTESYAALFAFMSLIEPDEGVRQDYAARSRTLLMYVMDQAVLGQGDAPFRTEGFSTRNRSRWYGVNFALTVDWIYPTLTAEDKATIHTVFSRWCEENINAAVTTNNHPEPIGVLNDPVLVSDPYLVRWAGNNYYTAHMRNIGMMGLSFDAADDPDGTMANCTQNAVGSWLYVVDHMLRIDSAGGLGAEGFEYSPQALGYVAQFLLALETAGMNDPAVFGQQVSFELNPFWGETIPAYFNSLMPVPVVNPDTNLIVYQPSWYGDAENYWMMDHIEMFGPMGIHAMNNGDAATLNATRWAELYTAPGSAENLGYRLQSMDSTEELVLYYLLFDPAAPLPTDPRPELPTTWYAPGIDRLLSRTSWGDDATFFSYALSWISVDHQGTNGNAIEFYRDGEWLTKLWTGYDFDYQTSDHLNTLTIANTIPEGRGGPEDYRVLEAMRGSQFLYVASGDPPAPIISTSDSYVYASGDATLLYNSEYEAATAIQHASRSVVWLKPDVIVIYDRAATSAPDPFMRFWLNFPANATVNGTVTNMTTTSGQQLIVETLLPVGATIEVSELQDEASAPPAILEPMEYRLMVEAPRDQTETRFLHVLQGADAGAAVLPTALIDSSEGTAYQGVQVGDMDILFPVEFGANVSEFSYISRAPTHLITGLTPGANYDVSLSPESAGMRVIITPGTAFPADAGGVLLVTIGP